MEMLLGVLFGGVVSWVISQYYYVRANKEKPDWLTAENLKEILAKNPNDLDWTAQQIIQLYESKIMSEDSSAPMPYSRCPQCGSDKLRRQTALDHKSDTVYYLISCDKCRWASSSE